MNKRDLTKYYAGMALQGLMANPERYSYLRAAIEEGSFSRVDAHAALAGEAKEAAEQLADEMEAAGYVGSGD